MPLSALGEPGCQLGGLSDGGIRRLDPGPGKDDVTAVQLLHVEPQVVFLGQLESQLVVLPVVPADINGVAVGGDEAHRPRRGLLHPPAAGFRPEVASGGQLLLDFLQLTVGFGPVQLVQYAVQVFQLRPAQLQLAGQLFLRVFGFGVVLIVFCRILLRRQQGGQSNLNGPQLRVIKILRSENRLALGDEVEIGRHQVAHLAQALPIPGCGELLVLDGHFPRDPVPKVLHGPPDRLGLLAHGVPPVPKGVKPVQKGAEGVQPDTGEAGAVLHDGHEGICLGRPICLAQEIRLPHRQAGLEIFRQTPGCGRLVRRFQPPVRVAQTEQSGLPAHQGGQAAEGIQKTVGQPVWAGLG